MGDGELVIDPDCWTAPILAKIAYQTIQNEGEVRAHLGHEGSSTTFPEGTRDGGRLDAVGALLGQAFDGRKPHLRSFPLETGRSGLSDQLGLVTFICRLHPALHMCAPGIEVRKH